MSRKETILIAVVINAGLLAILFVTAMIYETDQVLDQTELNTIVEAKDVKPLEPQANLIASASIATIDEVDNVLHYYAQPPQAVKTEIPAETYLSESVVSQEEAPELNVPAPSSERLVEVTVKKGDVLEKIARANGTTVSAIKKANNLQSERLSIGQVLKIPIKQDKAAASPKTSPSKQQTNKKETESSEPVYYVVKSGDSPWKIAKQFNVKFEDILRLNQLDEESARNMKVGDRIRVK